MRIVFAVVVLTGFGIPAFGDETFPSFRAETVDADVGNVCYAVTLADVDGDGKDDIVAVSENRVYWYANPTWERRVMVEDQTPRDNVCIAPHDIDGDGKVDFALGAGWTKIGTIHWLSRGESLEEKWHVHAIGEERGLHRMRWADVLGTGTPQLVISPLNASVGKGVRLTALEIPADPVRGRWQPTVLNDALNRMHNHWHVDFDGDGTADTLTASAEGVHLVRRDGKGWSATRIGEGAKSDAPNQRGSGEIKVGRLGKETKKRGLTFDYIATIEPMHGTMLAVYTPPMAEGGLWERRVIDEGFQRGHAVWTTDLDGDGDDDIVMGHSDTPDAPGVNAYECRGGSGTQWVKRVIDAGPIATEDLVVKDLTGDGKPDIVAGGRGTRNVKLYVNE